MIEVTAIVTSDLHLGSCYLYHDAFARFLDALPAGCELVLNGDVTDHWHRELPPEHEAVLERLRKESRRRTVTWVRGNHDAGYELEDPAEIRFTPHRAFGRDLYVSHGHDFDNVMPKNRLFIRTFRALHHLRLHLGAESIHVARYAKRFHFLYRVLIDHVAANAIEYARENGYRAVTCGHTHWVEEREVDGIRYLNAGSWTEPPFSYVTVCDGSVRLATFAE